LTIAEHHGCGRGPACHPGGLSIELDVVLILDGEAKPLPHPAVRNAIRGHDPIGVLERSDGILGVLAEVAILDQTWPGAALVQHSLQKEDVGSVGATRQIPHGPAPPLAQMRSSPLASYFTAFGPTRRQIFVNPTARPFVQSSEFSVGSKAGWATVLF
jgi:hypothetical protein